MASAHAFNSMPTRRGRFTALLVATACTVLLAGCKTSGTQTRSPGTGGTRPTPATGPAAACRAGFEAIGVLRVISNTVRVNGNPAATGQTICTDDEVTTNGSGSGEVVLIGGGDSVQLAENTDPRFRWTAARCLSVYAFERGTVHLKTSRHCMVLRTRDVLLYQARGGQVEYEVDGAGPGSRTTVKTFQGVVPLKLAPTTDVQLNRIGTDQELRALAAPATPLATNQLYIFKADQLLVPPRQLRPQDMRSIRLAPAVTPTAPATSTTMQPRPGVMQTTPYQSIPR